MKKKLVFGAVICVILCTVMAFSAFAASFKDLSSSHWAYGNIIELSSEGVINGYSDGTFRPEATVTRAEFVKLIGTVNVTKTEDFADLPKSHWAYSYVMNSGVDINKTNFRPDENITRAEVLDILWNRYGTATDIAVPGMIANQHDDDKAVAWAYSYGLMIGDDGMNLRLKDDLSRAEAVTLILRSRKVDTSSQKLLADNVDDLKTFIKWVKEGAKIMSSSSLRYMKEFEPYFKTTHEFGKLRYINYSMNKNWERYGIHLLEPVFCITGPGYVSVRNTGCENRDILHIVHKNDIDINLVNIYNGAGSSLTLVGESSSAHIAGRDSYYCFHKQLDEFVKYLETGERPYSFDETIELMLVIIAGLRSRKEGGREVYLDEIRKELE